MGDRDLILPGVLGVLVVFSMLLGARTLSEAKQADMEKVPASEDRIAEPSAR